MKTQYSSVPSFHPSIMNASSQPDPQTGSESHLTRRNFLKTTSAAVAGASVLGGLSIERSAFAAGSDTLKVALVGCGPGRSRVATTWSLFAD